MTLGINVLTLVFGLLALIAIVVIGAIGINMIVYAMIDAEPIVEMATETVESTLVTKL